MKKTCILGRLMLILACTTLPLAVVAADATLDAKAELGRVLFFDTSLSEPAGQSCATCHAPAAAFTDPDTAKPTSKGVHPERFGNRNTPSAMYMAFSPKLHVDPKEKHYVGGQFWDGRAATLEEQAKGPFLNPVEMANPNKRAVVEKVRRAAYTDQFDAVFGKGALVSVNRAYDHIAAAIAAYERTTEFQPFTSRYDAWLAGKGQLTGQELRGLTLYEDEKKGNCAACHPSQQGPNGEPPLFTDFTYDNLGVPRNPDNPFYGQDKKFNPQGTKFVEQGIGWVRQEARGRRQVQGADAAQHRQDRTLHAQWLLQDLARRGGVLQRPRCEAGLQERCRRGRRAGPGLLAQAGNPPQPQYR